MTISLDVVLLHMQPVLLLFWGLSACPGYSGNPHKFTMA